MRDHWSLFLTNTCPFAHLRNRLWDCRDGAPQFAHGTVASNPIVARVMAVVSLARFSAHVAPPIDHL